MRLTEFRSKGNQELLSGLIRIHVLYHASKEPIIGLGIIQELQRHGYHLSPGTIYPLLHGMERRGYLRSQEVRRGKIARRLYRASPAGRAALAKAREKVKELLGELLE